MNNVTASTAAAATYATPSLNPVYNDKVVRQFTLMTVVWGVVGMLVVAFITIGTMYSLLRKVFGKQAMWSTR